MSDKQFVMWLGGFFDGVGVNNLTEEQVTLIKNKLKQVNNVNITIGPNLYLKTTDYKK